MHTRFKGDQADNFSALKQAADDYPKSLSEDEAVGFWHKPLDWAEGHPNFLVNMYQLMNAIQLMQLKPKSTIVEVGSGTGWTTETLAGLGYKVVCLEPAERMIEVARQRVPDFLSLRRMGHLASNVTYHAATLEEADFLADGTADALLFFESFHHIIDEHKALDEAWRILRPGGFICILGDSNWIPGNQEQESFWQEEMQRFGTLESPFTHGYLTEVLKAHGFEDIGRHHGVNGFIPVEREHEPVRQFVGHLDATYLNLFTARKGARGGDDLVSLAEPAASPEPLPVAEPPPVQEPSPVQEPPPVQELSPVEAAAQPGHVPSVPNEAPLPLRLRIYEAVPALQPLLRWAWQMTRPFRAKRG